MDVLKPALWSPWSDTRNKPTRLQLRRFQHRLFVAEERQPQVWIVEAKATGALATGGSALDAVAEVDDTVAEPALLQQLQLEAGVGGECGLAFTDEHRINEELALIDQPSVERVRSIVVIEITDAEPLVSPAYDDGATEETVSERWLRHHTELHRSPR